MKIKKLAKAEAAKTDTGSEKKRRQENKKDDKTNKWYMGIYGGKLGRTVGIYGGKLDETVGIYGG